MIIYLGIVAITVACRFISGARLLHLGQIIRIGCAVFLRGGKLTLIAGVRGIDAVLHAASERIGDDAQQIFGQEFFYLY